MSKIITLPDRQTLTLFGVLAHEVTNEPRFPSLTGLVDDKSYRSISWLITELRLEVSLPSIRESNFSCRRLIEEVNEAKAGCAVSSVEVGEVRCNREFRWILGLLLNPLFELVKVASFSLLFDRQFSGFIEVSVFLAIIFRLLIGPASAGDVGAMSDEETHGVEALVGLEENEPLEVRSAGSGSFISEGGILNSIGFKGGLEDCDFVGSVVVKSKDPAGRDLSLRHSTPNQSERSEVCERSERV